MPRGWGGGLVTTWLGDVVLLRVASQAPRAQRATRRRVVRNIEASDRLMFGSASNFRDHATGSRFAAWFGRRWRKRSFIVLFQRHTRIETRATHGRSEDHSPAARRRRYPGFGSRARRRIARTVEARRPPELPRDRRRRRPLAAPRSPRRTLLA